MITTKWPKQYQRIISVYLDENKDIHDQYSALSFLEEQRMTKDLSKANQRMYAAALKWYHKNILGQKISLPMPYKKRGIPTTLVPTQIQKVFNRLPQKYLIIFKLMYACGLKVGDLTALRIKDIDINNGGFLLSKNRRVEIPHAVFNVLQAHLKKRQQQYIKDRENMTCFILTKEGRLSTDFEEQPFFASRKRTLIDSLHRGRSFIDPSTLHCFIKKAQHQAQLNHLVTTMTLRHSFAVEVLSDKGNILVLANVLGHQDIRLTMNYLKLVPIETINLLESLPKTPTEDLKQQIKTALKQPDKSQLDKILHIIKSQKCDHIKTTDDPILWEKWLKAAETRKISYATDTKHNIVDHIFLNSKDFRIGNPFNHIRTIAKALSLSRKSLLFFCWEKPKGTPPMSTN